MSKRSQEEVLISTKAALWNLGFEKNNVDATLASRTENIPRALKLVTDYLEIWPACAIMQDWQSIFLSYVQPRKCKAIPLSTQSPFPIVAAFARSQSSKIISDDDVVIIHNPAKIAKAARRIAGEHFTGADSGCAGVIANDDQDRLNLEPNSQRKRKLQQVVTKQARAQVTRWMVEDQQVNGQKGLYARTVRFFPSEFRGSVNANSMKASRWWASKEEILTLEKENVTMSQQQCGIRRVVRLKTKEGRGRKTAAWVSWLHDELCSEFDRLRKAGVKFSPHILKNLALDVLQQSDHPEFSSRYKWKDVLIMDKITPRWIQTFMDKKNIVGRAQTGKLMISPEFQAHLEKEIAYHLGVVGCEFHAGAIDEEMVENWDETHFVINMDNGKTLGFKGNKRRQICRHGIRRNWNDHGGEIDRWAICRNLHAIDDFSKSKLQLSCSRSAR
uniref:Uncharacterized protein n=1 Tax=Spongospora subterranea TaxID=70186 RepID=A0A0H5QXE5_9EUKA|eukprot:CRZ06615.1 hypothetical protein [Spongospora subterranea]